MSAEHRHDANEAKHGQHAPSAAHDARGAHRRHKNHPHEHAHHGPPPWLISFGDMMTLFLCFFIILVTLAKAQDAGLVARGLGPFVVALESKGLNAPLSGAKCLNAV